MKRLFVFLLLGVFLLGIVGCGKTQDASLETYPEAVLGEGLNAGYGRVSITPDYNIGLKGYANAASRVSKKVSDEIFLTCIAFTEGQKTVLVFTIDNCACPDYIAQKLRDRVSFETKIPPEHQFYGATHSHNCPSMEIPGENGEDYFQLVSDAAAKAAKQALSDRAPATVYAATPNIPSMNFVRHYKMADGSFAGANFGSFTKSSIVGHTAKADPQMILLKLDRAEKQDILMVNWQAHPDHSGQIGFYNISADFPGALRKKLESKSDMLVAYFTGASGNINPFSKIAAEDPGLNMTQYGQKLADHALSALSEMKPVAGSGIAVSQINHVARINHSTDALLPKAKEVYQLWQSKGSVIGSILAKQYGFSSVYECNAIINRAAQGTVKTIECYAFSIGGVGFVNVPYEMFTESGQYLKENAPYDITFIITGNNGYIPCENAFDYGAYEAVTCQYERGTAEAITQRLLSLLNSIQ